MPIIRRRLSKPVLPLQLSAAPALAILPLSYIAADDAGLSFAQGLSEELAHYLFCQFSYRVVPPSMIGAPAEGRTIVPKDTYKSGIYWLEGSIRFEAHRLRATFRLVDTDERRIAWAAHFERLPQFSISAQEELAASISNDLHRHFCDAELASHVSVA